MLLWFHKAFLMENGSSEEHVISIKELRWRGGGGVIKPFLQEMESMKGMYIAGKSSYLGNKRFLIENGESEVH